MSCLEAFVVINMLLYRTNLKVSKKLLWVDRRYGALSVSRSGNFPRSRIHCSCRRRARLSRYVDGPFITHSFLERRGECIKVI